jgi:hypothetical protein
MTERRGRKQRPKCIAIMASDDGGNEKVDDSNEGYVTATEHDFKHQT